MPKVMSNVKEDIINTAIKIIKEDGYKKFSIRYIAEQCGIGMGTIYNYYESKEDILNEIIHSRMMEILNKIEKQVGKEVTAKGKAENFFNVLKEFFTSVDKEFLNSFIPCMWQIALEGDTPIDKIRSGMIEHIEESQNNITILIRKTFGVEDDFEADAIAKLFLIYSQKKDFEFNKLWEFINKRIHI